MKFAVNYSNKTKALYEKGKINMDLFKCPDYDFDPELIESARGQAPIYIHFPLNIGQGRLREVEWDNIHRQMEETHTPYVNLHLVGYKQDFPDDQEKGTQEFKQDYIEAILMELEAPLKEFSPTQIILENVVWRGPEGKMLKTAIEPEVLSTIVKESGCGLLLDLAHAQMTAQYTGESVYDYLERLPTKHLRELHITGIQADGTGKLRDSMPMTEEDWRLVGWALSNIRKGKWKCPWVVSFEYGGEGPLFEWRTDQQVLARQVPKLYRMVRDI
ncbi:uncharacterized protein (UPF0276 family) [Pullulanibacillus pueri]|uniref:DUF692 family protein n=1 Tax=Pullulanibacillus pueri TaxID=1437324 RepID=A0A8J2ZRP8_9BACL|nr:DUF692 family multinuclear iron-containing protein [Pullulanibacillus pueri]MBM7680171.1 uncharacterized protein (UPF0276 family) [Pullulanibacillus pueri]GGH74696.1 hypothetical protein GCM10007096_03200 [Pullulanibacillus pueri]